MAKAKYRDCNGIPFDDRDLWLPPRVSDWPTIKKVKDAEAVSIWRDIFVGTECWWCGSDTNSSEASRRHGELHHMARYDFPFCMSWLCAWCHRLDGCAVTSEALGRLLYLKWQHDSEFTSWVHLSLAMRRRLPELVTG